MPKKPSSRAKQLSAVPAPLASESMPIDERIDVGLRFPVARLRTVAFDLLDEHKRDQTSLASYGFGPGWTAAIRALLDRIDELKKGRSAAELSAKPTGQQLDMLLGLAKTWRTRFGVVAANSSAARLAPSYGATSYSASALSDQVEKLAVFATEHAAEMESFGGGAAFAAEGRDLANKLRKAREAHAASINAVSPAARDLQAAKGTLYLELKRLSRAARAAVKLERRDRYALWRLLGRTKAAKKPIAATA